ncbi:hypothetical protein Cgig2_006961 [Carnegiea gigantea]|uniref:VWFA domain-containing protein n=1 Tax=Carnegiea gigantea TaxID=171969 RepID=A0A9Q1QGC0_9CARY|nr:hypothetical protein Cgig2_006961 [Carnegiea gigantea]
MADEFRGSVELGLQLSKRIYYGNEPSMKPPKQPPAMAKWPSPEVEDHLPKAPMVYAEISDPSIVDNPDILSYQPYVYGRCKPPALIPLHMYGIEVKVDCYLDMAFVTVSGSWRLHCVASGRSCDCRVAIPMGEQGSVLGFDIDASRGSYHTQLLTVEDAGDLDGLAKAEYGGLLKANLFTLKIPKVAGGSKLSVKTSWSQKLLYQDDKFSLSVPFSFPAYVTPPGKLSKREKILLTINSGTGTEILCETATHPLKVLSHEVEKLGFLYESEVFTWSRADFEFSYTISSGDIHGRLLLQPPPPNDCDQREMFAFYLFPGDSHNRKVFRKKVVFLVDISGSMKGASIENVKKAVLSSLSNLNQDDFFNIIAFNGEAHLFSSSMELASLETLQQAREWMSSKLIAEGYTNILLPMNQALHMVSHGSNSISFIFLITDGAVENERDICNLVKVYCTKETGLAFPRISTFGIGKDLFLALFVEKQMQLYPSTIQDLSYRCPVIMSGRYKGTLPKSLKVHGILADMTAFITDVTVHKAEDVPLDNVMLELFMILEPNMF